MSTPQAVEMLPEPPADECEREFDAVKPELEAATETEAEGFRGDAILIHHNVNTIVERIAAERTRRGRPLDTDEVTEAHRFRSLSLALVFAALRARASLPPRAIRTQLARARKLRTLLLYSAQACSVAELVPEHEIEDIIKGKGDLDRLRDCIDLVALFRRHADVLANKTPVTEDHLREASTLATSLLGELGVSPEADRPMAMLRDRCWTLLQRAYVGQWRLGAELWGPEVDDHLPKLNSRPQPRPRRTPAA